MASVFTTVNYSIAYHEKLSMGGGQGFENNQLKTCDFQP